MTSGLSRGCGLECEVWTGGRPGDHHSPGCPRPRSRRGSRCRPTRSVPPGPSPPGLCPGCTTRPAGPQLLSPGTSGHRSLWIATRLPSSPPARPCWVSAGATHHALGSQAPRPRHPHLHLHLPGREEDRSPAPHGTTEALRGRGQAHFFRAQYGTCGPGQLRAGPPPSPALRHSLSGLGRTLGEQGGDIRACQ